ncbi:MAG: hypothetical protein L6R37_008099 [Teloschistes peruensis]|nr:MAG: hypothetical protein L6R37_008099 [Teloschistes peruensis]
MTDKMTEMVDKAKEGFGKITDSLFGPKPNNAEEETAQQGQEQASPPDEGREEDPTAVATRFEDKRLEDDKKLKDDKKQEEYV